MVGAAVGMEVVGAKVGVNVVGAKDGLREYDGAGDGFSATYFVGLDVGSLDG